jgi:ATP-dependent phosphoenolpyruvate carboxykinase
MDLLLMHKPSHLVKMKDKIMELSLKEQAKYADAVCREMVKNKANFDNIILMEDSEVDFSDWNTTSIGNLAYIVEYSGQPHYKLSAAKLINRYRNFYKK